MVKVMSSLINAGSRLWFGFGVRAWTEMKIWCVKGMFMLRVVSSKKNLGFKGFKSLLYSQKVLKLGDCAPNFSIKFGNVGSWQNIINTKN